MRRVIYIGIAVLALAGGAFAAVGGGTEPERKTEAVKTSSVQSATEADVDTKSGCSKHDCSWW